MATHRDLAHELLRLAREDEAAAREMLGVTTVADAIVGFHAQQAVEKALKAVLAFGDNDFPFTHNLAQLATLCSEAGTPPPEWLADVDRLTPYGVRFRYGSEDLAHVERNLAVDWASGAVRWATRVIIR